jgi:hypothetical protein
MRRFLPLLVLVACRAPEPAKQHDVTIIGAPGDASAPASMATASSAPDAATAAPRRIEEVSLTIADAPSDAKALPAGKALALPGDYVDRIEDPPRWLVRSGKKKISVVDRDSGKTLGAIDSAYPDDLQRKHARLSGWQGADGTPALLSLADGRVRIPRGRLADGKTVSIERLFTDDALDDVIVMGRDAQKKRWLGTWKLATGDDVVLDKDAPVDSRSGRFDPIAKSFVLFVGTSGDGGAGANDCIAAFVDDKRSECFRTSREGSTFSDTLLHGGFVASADALVDTRAHREVRSVLERPSVAAVLDSPARSLVVVNDGKFEEQRKTMRRKFELLAPEGSFGTFHLEIKTDYENSFHSSRGQTTEPIVAEKGISQIADDAAAEWSAAFVDLERGRVIRFPAPVDTLTRGTVARRFLAVERGKQNDKLLFVDLDATKAVRIGTMPRCPGPYWPSVEKNGVLALVCSKQPNKDLFSFVHLWSEIVQVDTLKHWHFDGEALDVWPTGEIVRAAPGAVITEGGSPARGGVRVVNLQ